MKRRMLIGLLLLCLLLGSAAAENATTLAVDFYGLTWKNGGWSSEQLTGTFDVIQDGQVLGLLTSGQDAMALESHANVLLRPVADSMPADFSVKENAISVSIAEGQANRATVMAYADRGQFVFSGAPNKVYHLSAADGHTVRDLITDGTGMYTNVNEQDPSGVYRIAQGSDYVAAFALPQFMGQQVQVQAASEPCLSLVRQGGVLYTTLLGGATAGMLRLPDGWQLQSDAVSSWVINGQEWIQLTQPDMAFAMRSWNSSLPSASSVSAADFSRDASGVSAIAAALEASPLTALTDLAEDYGSADETGNSLTATDQPYQWVVVTAAAKTWAAQTDAQGTAVFANLPATEAEVIGSEQTVKLTSSGAQSISLLPTATEAPTDVPTEIPTETPTEIPTDIPTENPTIAPTDISTEIPTENPTIAPDETSTEIPAETLTEAPTEIPTEIPTATPMETPTATPTEIPTEAPTEIPTPAPTEIPTPVSVTPPPAGSASLTVSVYVDGNNNGEKTKYENLLNGATLRLIWVTDQGELTVAEGSSNDTKAISFVQMAAGNYVLEAELPQGYGFGKSGSAGKSTSSVMREDSARTQRTAAFSVADGQSYAVGVGAVQTASVSGSVWLDDNIDGIRTDNESMLANVRITLVGEKNGLTYETVTDAQGMYSFEQIKPGSYRLRAYTPEGYGFTRYSRTGGANRSILTSEGKSVASKLVQLKAGQKLGDQLIGMISGGAIEGIAFMDANYNGLYDEGEQPLAKVKVELQRQLNGDTLAQIITGEDGRFTFAGLRDNTYQVRAVLPQNGTTFTAVVAGGNQFKARPGRRENTAENIRLTIGETKQVPIGAILPGKLSGVAYLDNNFSGTRDKKEPVVSGMDIQLCGEDGTVLLTAKTNAKGVYSFDSMTPGRFILKTEAKRGYAFTKLGDGNVMLNMGSGHGASAAFDFEMGSKVADMHLGMILPGIVQGGVFADANDNGLRDADEVGLVGAVVRLMDDHQEYFSQTIGADGAFRFDAVMPGRYYLRYDMPEHAVVAKQMDGGNRLTGDTAGASEWFDFATGSTYDAPLAGGLVLGQISGIAFADTDADGRQGGGEHPLSGVTLTLKADRGDAEEISVTTAADGSFDLDQLRPATYRLGIRFPDALVLSRTAGTELPIKAGLAEQAQTLELPMGGMLTGQQIGGVKPASLSGSAWLDENNNGVWEADEMALSGISIDVVDESDGSVFAAMTTDAAGGFSAAGMIPGSYTLRYPLKEREASAPAGDSTFMADGGSLSVKGIKLTSGSSSDGQRLGLIRTNVLSGTVRVDRGGEVSALMNVEIALLDANKRVLQTVRTGEDGSYSFEGLLPGTFHVRAKLETGYLVVEPNDQRITDGRLNSVLTDVSGAEGTSDAIVLSMTGNYQNMDIGAVLPGRLGDRAWLDLNRNGMQDSDEGGLADLKIELIREGKVIQTAVTDQNGYWLMDQVYPARYTLRVAMPDQIKPTAHAVSAAMISSVLTETEDSTAVSSELDVQSDRHDYNADLGFVLRKDGEYPAGYGQTAMQNWTKTY